MLRIRDYGGLDSAILHQFGEVDCSRVLSNGMRNIQTDSYRYGYEVALTLAMIDMLDDEEKKIEHKNTLNTIHQNNLVFESINPPIPVKRDKNSKSSTGTKRKPKQERFDFDKEVVKAQKLRDKFKQFGTIKLNIKS